MIDGPLSDWHTFACEWMPDHVLFFCDGAIVNEYHNPDNIPSHPLCLKINYAIDGYALGNINGISTPIWQGEDSMVIDYVNVYQLNWDCDMDEVISCQTDFDSFDFGVKGSISITSTEGMVSVSNTDDVTFRAADSFEITGPFQVDSGGKMAVIMQSCPYDM